tara:strand:+ start:1905 stop:2768 length:864 start_codon:yes stop_codon:yes gene_type:complete
MSAYEPPTEILSTFNASLFPLKNAPQNEYVDLVSPQLIDGIKEFDDNIVANITGNAGTVTNGVYDTGNQTIAGTKTFSTAIAGSVTGNAGTVTGGVVITGNQTIGGTKTFSTTITGAVSGNAGSVTNGIYTSSNVTALNDVTSAGSGAIITATERTKLTNIGTIISGSLNSTAITNNDTFDMITVTIPPGKYIISYNVALAPGSGSAVTFTSISVYSSSSGILNREIHSQTSSFGNSATYRNIQGSMTYNNSGNSNVTDVLKIGCLFTHSTTNKPLVASSYTAYRIA